MPHLSFFFISIARKIPTSILLFQDLHNLRKTLDRERHEAVSAWEEKVRALREECGSAVERARSQGELEKASLLAEVQRRTERALDKSSLPVSAQI